ncbi:hypothetical protein KC356_g3044 [Hortaea werneckii]|nr:hypothetical protein KC356_g3044 [Hortaea werneckii]
MASGSSGVRAQRPSFAKIAAAGSQPPNGTQKPTQQTSSGNPRDQITSAPRNDVQGVTPFTLASDSDQSNGLQVRVHSVDGAPRQSSGTAAASGLLAPATSEDSNTQVSSDSGSAKPPSLDGKSVASGTTFALDEKESLRPDDSASAKAADDEDIFSPPSSSMPASRMSSDDAQAFHDQLREISSINPQRRSMTPQGFRQQALPQKGVLYVPPQGPGMGAVPNSRTDPEQQSPVDAQPDPKLLEALESPRDRIWVLKLEQDIYDFVKDPKEASLNLPQCNAYHRMLAHKIADYYLLGHIVDDSASAVRLYKTPYCRIPPPLTGITTPSTAASTPPPPAPQMKILRRGIDAGPVLANGSNVPSKSGSEDGSEDDKKPKPPATREEREARYEAARLRIMGSAKPTESPEDPRPKNDSRSSSVTGKKSKKKQRSNSEDGFEARSAYSAYYTPPYNAHGLNASSYGFPAFTDSAPGQQSANPVAFHQSVAPQGFSPYAAQLSSGIPWASQGFTAGGGTNQSSWSQQPQHGFDLAANFQQAMSFQSPAQSTQASNASPASFASPYQQQYYGGHQAWISQGYPNGQGNPPNSAYVSGNQYRPQSSAGNQGNQNYQYGQLPSQALGRPPSKLEHPLPGSYKGKHFNPQSQTFIPGQQGEQADESQPVPPHASAVHQQGFGPDYAGQHLRQASAPMQGPAYGSPRQLSGSSSTQGLSQPMMHPLPQPVFPRQPSPNLPLPPKPNTTPQRLVLQQQPLSTPSPTTANANQNSSISKWGTPASLPAKPPPSAEPFDSGKISQMQRQPSYQAALPTRASGGGISFGSMPPLGGDLGVNGMGSQRHCLTLTPHAAEKTITFQARSGLTMNHVTTAGVHVGTQMLNRLYQPASARTNTTTVGAITPPTTAAEQSASAHVKLFAQDVQEYGAPKFSSFNPDGIRNNCVLVTLAYLMGLKSVNELNPQIQATFQAEQRPSGINRKTILKILELTGRQFRYEPWKFKPAELAKAEAEAAEERRKAIERCDEKGISEAEAAQRRREAKVLCDKEGVAEAEAAKRRRQVTEFCFKWDVEEIGIWYVRINSKNEVHSGHCIVLKDYYWGKSSDGDRIVMPGAFPEQYVDYQKSSTGDDRWSEVRGGRLTQKSKDEVVQNDVMPGAFPEQYVDYQKSSTGDDRWSEVEGDWLTQISKDGVQNDTLRIFVVGAFALTPPPTS